jgi:hypothetical protein
VPLAEEPEACEVEILGGATVKRVLSTATTSAVCSAARQTTDRHLVTSGATGLWSGRDLNVAFRVDGVRMRLVPRPGWLGSRMRRPASSGTAAHGSRSANRRMFPTPSLERQPSVVNR